MLAHMLEFKIARDGCSNYINARVRKDLVHAVFTAREAGLLFVFVLLFVFIAPSSTATLC